MDDWLRATSPFFRKMAEQVDSHGGYSIRVTHETLPSMTLWENGQRAIALVDTLKGPVRASCLIMELTNFFQEEKHQQLEDNLSNGTIKESSEYAILRSLIELDGLRFHRTVLEELDKKIDGGIPKEMLSWIEPSLQSLAEYTVPAAYDYVNIQRGSAYRKRFEDWFAKRKQELESAPKGP